MCWTDCFTLYPLHYVINVWWDYGGVNDGCRDLRPSFYGFMKSWVGQYFSQWRITPLWFSKDLRRYSRNAPLSWWVLLSQPMEKRIFYLVWFPTRRHNTARWDNSVWKQRNGPGSQRFCVSHVMASTPVILVTAFGLVPLQNIFIWVRNLDDVILSQNAAFLASRPCIWNTLKAFLTAISFYLVSRIWGRVWLYCLTSTRLPLFQTVVHLWIWLSASRYLVSPLGD